MRILVAIYFVVLPALLVAGCSRSPRDVSDYLSRAETLQASGEREKAKVELHRALAINSRDVKANLALAKIEDLDGDIQAAVSHYALAAGPEAHLLEPQLRLAEILMDSERYADATGRINTTLGAFPGNADVLALRADLEERQGQTGQALTDATAAVQKDRNNLRAMAVMASLALRDNDIAKAQGIVDRGLQLSPNNIRLLQVHAAALLTVNQPEKAVDALKSIMRASPRNIAIQSAIAHLEARNGHLDDAIAGFKSAVAADPSNAEMQLSFVNFLAEQDKSSTVVDYLKQVITANPNSNLYDLTLAEYFRSKGRLQDAGTVLDAAADRLKQKPEYPTVRIAQAKWQTLGGHPEVASQMIDEVLAVDPKDEQALLFRATLDAENERMASAVSNLLKVVRQNPTNAEAFQLMASAYLALGQPKLAVDAMQRAVAIVPGDTDAQIRLASFLQRAGQKEASRDLITRLTLQFPTDAKVWVANGELASDRKDWAAVARAIARLRELPNNSSLVAALTGLSKLAQGDNAGAAKSYADLIAGPNPVDPGIFGAYAQASSASGQAEAAADFIEQHVSSLKNEALEQAWTAIMTLRADSGQFEQAGAAFAKAVAAAPSDPNLYGSYIRILIAQNKVAASREVVAKGLAAGAPKTPMLLISGGLDELTGDTGAALKTYKEALASNPMSIKAANNYGSLVADQEPKNQVVLQQARDALNGTEASTDPLLVDTVAWLDYRLGRVDEAKQLLDRIGAAESANPQLRFHIGAVLLASGDRTGGLALLEPLKGLRFQGVEEARSLAAS